MADNTDNISLKSREQILGDMLASYWSQLGVTDEETGSVFLSLLEAAAQSDFEIMGLILAALDSRSIDRAEKDQLDLIGAEEDVTRLSASRATGYVTLGDSSFTKISSRIYSGEFAPVAGTTIVYVDDASEFPDSGSVIIGRGTDNVETNVAYASKTQVGAYWRLNLSSSLVKFHNKSEEVTVSQGGERVFTASSVIETPSVAGVDKISFTLTNDVILLDGEDSVDGAGVTCQTVGSIGNVEANAVNSFASAPFQGATATNPLPFTNGLDKELDFDYKERIKKARFARSKGILQACVNAVIGLTSSDEEKRVLSAVGSDKTATTPTSIFIDDGTGYEPIFRNVGFESVIDSADGGEDKIQLRYSAVVKSQLVTTSSQPYALQGDENLSVLVGGALSEHQFVASDFSEPGSASAYEVVASINANSELSFSARTVSGGTKVVIFAKGQSEEDLEIIDASTNDANSLLGFPTYHSYTLFLYKNDELLNKDGVTPKLTSNLYPWVLPGGSYTLRMSVDNTSFQTYTFDSVNLAPFTPANAPIETWKDAFNSTIPGITTVVQNNRLVMESNKGSDNNAGIELDPDNSTILANNQMFIDYSSFGSASDYSFNKGTGQIQLATQLNSQDTISAGTSNFKAFVKSGNFNTGSVSVTSSVAPTDANLWFIVDSDVEQVTLSITTNISLSITNPSTNKWRYSDASGGNTFLNVEVGDKFILWDTAANIDNRGGWVVSNCSATFVEVEKSAGLAQSVTINSLSALSCFRSDGELQQVTVTSGIYTLDNLANAINLDLKGATATPFNTLQIKVETNTPQSGSLSLLAADNAGQTLQLPLTVLDTNNTMHIAGISSDTDKGSPLFISDRVSSGNTAADTFTSSVTQTFVMNPDKLAVFQKSFTANSFGNNTNKWVGLLTQTVTGDTSLSLVTKQNIVSHLQDDRLYFANGFDFTAKDSIDVVLDNDPNYKYLTIPLYRTIAVTTTVIPTVSSFDAIDVDGNNQPLLDTFGSVSDFDFTNYRLWGQARAYLSPKADGTANFLVASNVFGPTGEQTRFKIEYPTSFSTSITATVVSSTFGGMDVALYLESGAPRNATWDQTTAFSVSANGLVTAVAGTTPNFISSGVTIGDMVKLGSTFSTANRGVFKVTGVAATSLTVSNPSMAAQSSFTLNATANLQFYPLTVNNSASNLVNFINTSVSNYLEAQTVGAGTGDVFDKFYETSFNSMTPAASGGFVSLVDGQNWVNTYDPSSSPNFVTEVPLIVAPSLAPASQYRLIPYNTQQVVDLFNQLAVSGISDLGTVKASNNGDSVNINSNNFGTAGAVQIVGGSGNSAGGTIIEDAVSVSSLYDLLKTTVGATDGLQQGSWIKLTSALPLKKELNLSVTTQFIVTGNSISVTGPGVFSTVRAISVTNTSAIRVSKQDPFVAYTYINSGTTASFQAAQQGDFLQVSGPFDAVNQGTFRVVRAITSTIWVENTQAVEQDVSLTGSANMVVYTADSLLPGDTIVASGSILGLANNGTYTVLSSTTNSALVTPNFAVTITSTPTSAINNLQAFDQAPSNVFRKVRSIIEVDPTDASQAIITVDDYIQQVSSKLTDDYQFTFTALNKLNFPTTVIFGIDGYSAYKGLIKEATNILYGDPTNPSAYPGVKGAGEYIEILPPLIKKAKMTVGVRLRTGVPFASIANTIRSTISGVINASPIGQKIAISNIISAINILEGVSAVSIIDPVFSSTSDALIVGSNEKLLVIDPNDITVVPLS